MGVHEHTRTRHSSKPQLLTLIQAVTVFCSDYKTRGTSLTVQTRAKKLATSRDNDLSPNLGHHRHLPYVPTHRCSIVVCLKITNDTSCSTTSGRLHHLRLRRRPPDQHLPHHPRLLARTCPRFLPYLRLLSQARAGFNGYLRLAPCTGSIQR